MGIGLLVLNRLFAEFGVSATDAALALSYFSSTINNFRELSFKDDIDLLYIKLSSDKEFIEVAKSLLTYLD